MREVKKMYEKKSKPRREPSYTPRFVWMAVVVLLIVLLVIGIAKFATLKTLFWLE